MKTWEMIKELTENPSKRFTYDTATKGSYVTIENDGAVWRGQEQDGQMIGVIITNDAWKEVKKPVSFMEAFTKMREDFKDIYCIHKGKKHYFKEDCEGVFKFREDLIADGEWYIEG